MCTAAQKKLRYMFDQDEDSQEDSEVGMYVMITTHIMQERQKCKQDSALCQLLANVLLCRANRPKKRMDVHRTINLSAKKFTTEVPPIRKYIKVASGLKPSESEKLEHVLNVTVQINNPPEVAETVESGGTAYMSQQDGQNVIEGSCLT